MKKITLLFMTLLLSNIIMAQLPAGSFFEFGFTGGSLANTSASGASNFTGSITSITDRFGNANDAADISGPLSGASVGAANVNEMTLSFWMKHASLGSNERVIQVYGAGGVGFRLQMTGSVLLYNGTVANTTSGLSASHQETVNIDDNAWHHIVVRTTLISPNTLEFDVFLDNVLLPNMSNTTITLTNTITRFIENGTLAVSPTDAYTGDIDDIYFYKSALTDAQITQIYNYNPCTINIPDANFKAYLVGNTAINTNGDTEIQCSEASAYNGNINCNTLSINSMAGIEAFTNISGLSCANNQLTSLDVSANTALTILTCDDNQITSLNLSANTMLENLYCDNNQITSLDLSNLTMLVKVECYINQLTSLNVNNNTSLEKLYCYDNQLVNLDLSSNTSLLFLSCGANLLTTLNVANGNNTNMDGAANPSLYALNNPNLTCIQIDAGYTPNSFDWRVDAIASYSTNCGTPPCTVNIPDANFKAYLVGNTAINTNGDTEIQCSEASAFTGTISCNNLSISDLTGIEAFTQLRYLRCFSNQLTILDLSQNIDLIGLTFSNNQLTSIDLSNNMELTEVIGHSNQINALDVSNCPDLITFWIYNNQLLNLDVSNNPVLTALRCEENSLSSLNVANGNNTLISVFNSSNNPNLTCIQVDNVAYSTANWINIDAQSNFNVNCSSTVLVSSIIVQGSGGASTITTQGGTLQMFATVFPGNADDATYNWSVTNGTGSATISSTGLLTTVSDGTVDVIATANDASGVSGSSTITISNQNTQVVLVNSIIVQGQGGVSSITSNGGTLQMEATVLPANADDASYIWSVTNGTGSATIDVNGLLAASGDGTVEVTAIANDASGITGTKTITISNQSVRIKDHSFQNLNVYPNPTSDFINLDISEVLTSIRIMDLSGKTVKVFDANSKQLNISEFTSGIYFLEVANAESKSMIKIIKK